MSRSHGGGVKSEPNLTPILDMVFQLITFFMLVISFKAAELDMTLNLPVVGSARPVKTEYDHLLVLNIKDVGGQPNLSVYNRLFPKDQIESYIAGEARSSMFRDHVTKEQIDEGEKELSDTVVIRADDKTPFGHVNFVVTSCQKGGFRKFALKAMQTAGAKK